MGTWTRRELIRNSLSALVVARGMTDLYSTPTQEDNSVWIDDQFIQDQEVLLPTDQVTVTGGSNLDSGTELIVALNSKPGVENPFSIQYGSTVGTDGRWSADYFLGQYDPGAEFTITVRKSGDQTILLEKSGRLYAEQVDIDSTDFIFEDQESTGNAVEIQTATLPRGGFIVIEDNDNRRLGQSTTLQSGTYEDIAIALDSPIEPPSVLTAVLFEAEEDPYENKSGNRITRTAQIDPPEDPGESDFEIIDLNPDKLEVDPGESFDLSVTVENTGEAVGTQTITLLTDGEERRTQRSRLQPGDQETIGFENVATDSLKADQVYLIGIETDDDDDTVPLTILPKPTPTSTPSATPILTPTPSPSPAPTPSSTPSPTFTPNGSITPSQTPTSIDDLEIPVGRILRVGGGLISITIIVGLIQTTRQRYGVTGLLQKGRQIAHLIWRVFLKPAWVLCKFIGRKLVELFGFLKGLFEYFFLLRPR